MPSSDDRPDSPPPTLPLSAESQSAESVMADYLERSERGESPRASDYIARHPQHADELRSFFENHHWLTESPEASGPSLVGRSIGPYRIESEIARGGMGVVYRATQTGLGRTVALKLISSGILAGSEERVRFRNEAEAAARLQHPGIVPIHDTGTWEGNEYFSMTLVDGPTLESWVRETRQTLDGNASRPYDFRCIAEIVRDIAVAVDYAHCQGIVHRDLKPDNILLDQGVRPMVTDFGLAKWHREGTIVTRTGQVLGTPNYMSPEQAAGFSDGDTRVDVYALGAILYSLLCGRPPHEGPSVAEVLRSVLQDEPVSARHHCRDVPEELETICCKAMRFTPDERYGNACELADDLDRFLAGEDLAAHQSGLVDVVARELHRDQHQVSFLRWGRTLKYLGWIILLAHIAIYGLTIAGMPHSIAYWIPRLIMLASLIAVIRWSRSGNLLPRTAAERPVWSIWLGYLATLGTVNGLLAMDGLDSSALFPIASAMSGFGFIAMAGHVWGGSALLGLGFLLVAVLTAWTPLSAPLWFGAMWWLALQVLGHRYLGDAAT